ncbi:hypothetical protein G7054_g2295 [Neopestalotiopsis clavispora]|nr:hypothetical protein G7054_g2295 [Neopestalotiopsis clavispora]
MPADMDHRWAAGPKRPKAKSIPDEVWEVYETEIREKYTTMTKDELAAELKSIHGFEPTSRQFTARIERWGLKKYKTKNAAPEVMADTSGGESFSGIPESNEINRRGFSTAIPEGSKPRRTVPDVGERDRDDTQDPSPGTVSAKKLKVDDEETALHQSQVLALAENRIATDFDGVMSKNTIQDLPADPIHDWQGFILSEATVQSILGQFKSVDQHAVQNIDIEWCLEITSSIKNLRQPRQSPELSFDTVRHLKVVADYLFAMGSFAEAANIYIILSGSERCESSSTSFFTSTLISAVRAARSKEDCLYLQETLKAIRDRYDNEKWSPLEQALAHMLLTSLSLRLGTSLGTCCHDSVVPSLIFRHELQRDSMDNSSNLLLVYAHYKWLYCPSSSSPVFDRSRIPAIGDESSISHEEFVQFFKESYVDVRLQAISIRDTLRGNLQWCLEANPWVHSAFQSIETIPHEPAIFASLWSRWHEQYSYSINIPRWTLEQSLGISLAEHFTICAKVIYVLAEGAVRFHESDFAITLYLQALCQRVSTVHKPPHKIKTDDSVSRPASMAKRMPSSISSSMPSQMGDSKLPNLLPTIVSSLESNSSSYRRFKEASEAMSSQQQKEPSYKSEIASSASGIEYSLYGSNPPSMSFLSEVFARSCNVSASSTPQGSGTHRSSSQHPETSVNGDVWMDLEMEVVSIF